VWRELQSPGASSPVGGADVSVVGEVVLVGALPGHGGPGSPTHFAPQGDALSAVTRDVTQRHEELRGNWRSQNTIIKCRDDVCG